MTNNRGQALKDYPLMLCPFYTMVGKLKHATFVGAFWL